MTTSSHSNAISSTSPIGDPQPQVPPSQQAPSEAPAPASIPVPPHPFHPAVQSASVSQTSTPASSSLSPTSPSEAAAPPPTKSKLKVKAPNVFTNDGSFLDRMRRSMMEEEVRRKEKEIQARLVHVSAECTRAPFLVPKLQFADRFKSRGKRHMSPEASTPGGHSTSDVTPESEGDPSPKRRKLHTSDRSRSAGESSSGGSMTAQEEYHNAMESYPTSLKDSGTGVRPLIK